MLTNKKVFVTGATGFIGANLARRLLAENNEVHILTRAASDKWRLADILGRLHEHVADLNDKEKLSEILNQIKPEIIFHLATFSFFRNIDFRAQEQEIIKTNLFSSINLIKACENFEYLAFINTGTSSEYGPKNEPMKELDVLRPQSVYALSKAAVSMYVNFYAASQKRPVITIRPFSPFGPYDDFRRLIPEVIYKALKSEPITIKNPVAVRDYIYVDDLISAYINAGAFASQFPGDVFNVGSGVERQIIDVANKIVNLCGSQSQIVIQPDIYNANESPHWQADTVKTAKAFGWEPKYPFDDGLSETIDWFKKNLELYNNKYPSH